MLLTQVRIANECQLLRKQSLAYKRVEDLDRGSHLRRFVVAASKVRADASDRPWHIGMLLTQVCEANKHQLLRKHSSTNKCLEASNRSSHLRRSVIAASAVRINELSIRVNVRPVVAYWHAAHTGPHSKRVSALAQAFVDEQVHRGFERSSHLRRLSGQCGGYPSRCGGLAVACRHAAHASPHNQRVSVLAHATMTNKRLEALNRDPHLRRFVVAASSGRGNAAGWPLA